MPTPGGRELVMTMRAHGAYTCLISGGFTLFTNAVAAMIGFQENRANELLRDSSWSLRPAREAQRAGTARRAPVAGRRSGSRAAERPAGGDGVEGRRSDGRRRRPFPALRRHGQRQDRGLPPGRGRGARTRARDDRARPGDRARAADRRAVPRPFRRLRRDPALGAERRGAARRARAHRERGGARGCRCALGDLRPDARGRSDLRGRGARRSYKQESDRLRRAHGGREAGGVGSAVALYGSATPRPESWERLERLDLGERLGGRLPGVRIVDLRREAGYPLSRRCSPSSASSPRTAARRSCS